MRDSPSASRILSPPPSSFGGFERSPARLRFFSPVPGVSWGWYFGSELPIDGARSPPLESRSSVRVAARTAGPPSMKTFSAKPHEVRRDWFVVDATDKVLGRARRRDRAPPARQAQARVHAARRHRRLHRRRQRGQAARHRQQGAATRSTTATAATPAASTRPLSTSCRRASRRARWRRRSRACCPRDRWATRCSRS